MQRSSTPHVPDSTGSDVLANAICDPSELILGAGESLVPLAVVGDFLKDACRDRILLGGGQFGNRRQGLVEKRVRHGS